MNMAATIGSIKSLEDRSTSVHMDVWSRSGSKYRIRAIILLVINIALFACVGCFAFWLRTGEFFAPASVSYWGLLSETFRFSSPAAGVSLGSLLLVPINVQEVEPQIAVLGLLMASLISIPILTSILYGFWASLPFTAVVGVLAVMPWLAITLIGSCVIASVPPFRSRFRFMSALFGLVPTVIYLLLAWRGSSDVLAGAVDPVDRMKFVAPWVLAIVAATVVFAIVLIIARIVAYRPGAIAPLLALMFGLPVGLFESYVGRDELYYRLLESRYRQYFADVDVSAELSELVRETWVQHPHPRPTYEALRERTEILWQLSLASDLNPSQSQLVRHQADLSDRCDWFRRQFPSSRYTLNVLYLKATALDMRVDPKALQMTEWIRFYDDFPSPASASTWNLIAANDHHSSIGAIAYLRLASLDARAGRVERARGRLRTMLALFDKSSDYSKSNSAIDSAGALSQTTPKTVSGASPAMDLQLIMLKAQSLYDLLAYNRDPIYGYEPLSGPRSSKRLWFGLLDLEPRHRNYLDNLRLLKQTYRKCQISDNIDLEIAKLATKYEDRIAMLKKLIEAYPRGDALPEALFRLARAYQEEGQLRQGEDVFARLSRDYPKSMWTRRALYQIGSVALIPSTGSKP